MKRFIFLVAFFTIAAGSNAQVVDPTAPLRSAGLYNRSNAMVPGTSLPTEPLSGQAMPYVLIFSVLSPLRAAEAVMLGVTTVKLLNSTHSNGDYDDGPASGTRKAFKWMNYRSESRARRGSNARRGYIDRHF